MWRSRFTEEQIIGMLAIADDCTHVCLALVADTSLSGRRVARELTSNAILA